MNLDKISLTLCLAFQISDGPFKVLIFTSDGIVQEALLSKEEIKNKSLSDTVINIDLCRRISQRRWRVRFNPGRRKVDKLFDWRKPQRD